MGSGLYRQAGRHWNNAPWPSALDLHKGLFRADRVSLPHIDRFYHAGDTIIYDDYIETLKRLPLPDVVMLPVNGRDYHRETEFDVTGNLLPVEAARLARDLSWDVLIPGHNDLYPNNTIPFGEIVHALETTAPRQKYKILQPGELFYYVK